MDQEVWINYKGKGKLSCNIVVWDSFSNHKPNVNASVVMLSDLEDEDDMDVAGKDVLVCKRVVATTAIATERAKIAKAKVVDAHIKKAHRNFAIELAAHPKVKCKMVCTSLNHDGHPS